MTTPNGHLEEEELDELIGNPAQDTLELSTRKPDAPKAEPKGVKIDGNFYAYVDANEWSLNQRNAFKHQYERLQNLENVKNPTEQHEEAYNRASIKLLQMCVPDLPAEVLEYLNIGARTTLLMDFFLKAAVTSHFFAMMKNLTGGNLSWK